MDGTASSRNHRRPAQIRLDVRASSAGRARRSPPRGTRARRRPSGPPRRGPWPPCARAARDSRSRPASPRTPRSSAAAGGRAPRSAGSDRSTTSSRLGRLSAIEPLAETRSRASTAADRSCSPSSKRSGRRKPMERVRDVRERDDIAGDPQARRGSRTEAATRSASRARGPGSTRRADTRTAPATRQSWPTRMLASSERGEREERVVARGVRFRARAARRRSAPASARNGQRVVVRRGLAVEPVGLEEPIAHRRAQLGRLQPEMRDHARPEDEGDRDAGEHGPRIPLAPPRPCDRAARASATSSISDHDRDQHCRDAPRSSECDHGEPGEREAEQPDRPPVAPASVHEPEREHDEREEDERRASSPARASTSARAGSARRRTPPQRAAPLRSPRARRRPRRRLSGVRARGDDDARARAAATRSRRGSGSCRTRRRRRPESAKTRSSSPASGFVDQRALPCASTSSA